MYARHASFDDVLATAYGIVWVEDLFAPADEDSRYTTDVEAFLGAQNEWMTNHLPKRGAMIEVNEWGQPKLPPKAERVWGKPGKADHRLVSRSRGPVPVRRFPDATAKEGERQPPSRRRRRSHGGEATARCDAQGHGNDRRPAHRRPS